jgi:hypothetical protein
MKADRRQETKGVCGQKIVRNRIDFPKSDNNADEPDDRQTDADHGRGDGEDVNANIFFEKFI